MHVSVYVLEMRPIICRIENADYLFLFRSWYKNGKVNGRVTALFGGSAVLYKRLIEKIRAEDFDIEYRSPNPFRFLGNGFTQEEFDDESDLSWYIEH